MVRELKTEPRRSRPSVRPSHGPGAHSLAAQATR
jgi:hypothetical protein